MHVVQSMVGASRPPRTALSTRIDARAANEMLAFVEMRRSISRDGAVRCRR
jgi:hypothetical protein